MNRIGIAALILITLSVPLGAQTSARSYLGFDRNDYPGDAAVRAVAPAR